MPAARRNIVIEKGATFNPVWTWYLEDENGVKTPVDITGYLARMKIKDDYGGNVILSLLSGAEISLGGTAGTITFDVSAAVTEAIPNDTGVYDLELESPSGVVTRLIQGKVKFSEEVTV